MLKSAKPKKEILMEETLWKSADKLRGSVKPAEYKHIVLSLFFLKFASDKFQSQRKMIAEKYGDKLNPLWNYFKRKTTFIISGKEIHKNRTEVLLIDDLKQYLYNKYEKDHIISGEVDRILLKLHSASGTLYEANKDVYKMLCNGFKFEREDKTLKDIYIELIDFDTSENNIFKTVNQFEIEGIGNYICIPDGIVFINGILPCSVAVLSAFSLKSRQQGRW